MSFNPHFETHNLLLTSSLDWTVNLYDTKDSKSKQIQAIKTFVEFDDYVADVEWSCKHPAVFAACTQSGGLDLFNLNVSDVKVASVNCEQGLNKLAFSKDGEAIAVGGFDGFVDVYDVKSVVVCRDDDAGVFAGVIRDYSTE
jgi:WD40 repeat protein